MLGETLKIRVVKADGSLEYFKRRKIMRSLLRAGASKATAAGILDKIEGTLYDGITTKEIKRRVRAILPKEDIRAAMRYDLKAAIMRLGPAGFQFETFVAEVLDNYGYKTKLRTLVKGRCVQHEVDVIAEKSNGDVTRCMIECKYHNLPGNSVDLKDVLYTYARFLDLNEGSSLENGDRFDEVWMVSNTKASVEATKYAKCRGMKLLCWKYPKDMSLERMIEARDLYPVTVLSSVDRETLGKLFAVDLMLAKDLLTRDIGDLRKAGLSKGKLEKLISEAKHLLSKPETVQPED